MVFCDTLKYGLQTHNITVYPWLQEALPQTTPGLPLDLSDFRPQRPGPHFSDYIPATAFQIKDDCYGI